MKYLLCILLGLLVANVSSDAEEPTRTPIYEFAIVKWDGPDRLSYNLPDQFEFVQMKDRKVPIPKDAQPEEFWLAYAANEMAKQGWEAVNLNSRRILFRRLKK